MFRTATRAALYRASMMKLHWSPRSPFVRKVLIVAHERGLTHRITCLRTMAAMTAPHAALMRDNPLSKIPTLVLEDGSALYDSTVICEYLDGLDEGPKLFPTAPQERLTAIRRQALADGLMDLLVLARNERERSEPSAVHLESVAIRTAAVLHSLEKEAGSLAAAPFGIGHITIGCALGYLDFRFAEYSWRKDHPRIASWYYAFAARPSVRATEPVDDAQCERVPT